ncbi:glycosyltransferase [Candidatus Microgenomates bacterium]|nr:glycosyltransferase [Candidatus Microgenomates bacterium]
MKKKQLHIVNKYFHPVVAGIETCLLETYGRFNLEEWDITVHTSTDTLTDENVLPNHDEVKGMRIIRYATVHGAFFPNIPWHDADVVLLNNFSLAPILPVIAYAFVLSLLGHKKTAIVLTPHGGFTPIWESFEPWKRIVKKCAHLVGGFLINHTVDAVQAVAEWEKEQMIAEHINPALITVIPNGVEDIAFDKTADASPAIKQLASDVGSYVVMLSRVHPTKNIETAVNAMQYVQAPYRLLIMGRLEYPDYYEKLLNLVHNLDLEERVIFADQVTGADKYYLLRHASLMLHTSKYEVDPIAVKEGLSQGIPAVCADNTGTARLIKDGINGYLVPTNNHVQTAEKINFVIDNLKSPAVMAMKKHNKTAFAKYRWNKVVSDIEQLFIHIAPQWSLSYSS